MNKDLVNCRTHLSARNAIAADLIKSQSQVRRCVSGVEPLISKRAARAKRFNDLTVTRQRHEFPADFSIRYFQPGNTWRRAAIRPGHAAGIEKQNTTASVIARNVRMGVQENIYIIRRMIGWNVLQSEFQTASQKINDKRPLKIGIAISAHDDHARSNRPQLIKNRFRANVAKMPDLNSIFGYLPHVRRQTIVRVSENEDAPNFRMRSHVAL